MRFFFFVVWVLMAGLFLVLFFSGFIFHGGFWGFLFCFFKSRFSFVGVMIFSFKTITLHVILV